MAVEHLAQELKALEAESSRLAQRLASAYGRYLELLQQALPQQLVQACYVLCTQVHPQEFLQLSYDQRHQLQQQLKQLGQATAATLTLDRLQQQAQRLQQELDLKAKRGTGVSLAQASDTQALSAPSEQTLANPLESAAPLEEPQDAVGTGSLAVSSESPPNLPDQPGAIARWLQQTGETIRWQLRQASIQANHLLQQAQILSTPLPQELLAASLSEEVSQPPGGPPNLLRLLVTREAEDGSEEVQQVAVALRLPEIEFADPHLMDRRRELQGLVQELRRLGQRYAEHQRQWAIAQAEAAWRTSWPRD
jgi:hypothetical protein